MIDMHSHIIPNVDDGSKSIEASINMLLEEIKFGVTDVICTPHYRRHMFETLAKDVNLSFFNLQEEIKKRDLPINIYLGQEIFIHSLNGFKRTLDMLDNNEIFTFGNTKYILIEFSYTEDIDITEAVYMACVRGYKPIIAHIERYKYIDSIDKVVDIIESGALIQINASSIVGKDGLKTKKFIKSLVKNDYINFVSSDIHASRINYLEKAYKYVSKKFSKEIADNLFNDNANRILINAIKEKGLL